MGLSVWACVLTRSQLTPIISNIFNLTLWESPWVRSGAALMLQIPHTTPPRSDVTAWINEAVCWINAWINEAVLD